MSIKKWIIFDFDGTLSDARDRQHFVTNGNEDWDGFFEAVDQDAPIGEIAEFYKNMVEGGIYNVAIFTGRPERVKAKSENWLIKHGLPVVDIYCRLDNDKRHDLDAKREIYENFIKDGKQVSFIVEDRNSVVNMWRSMGIVCLHCFDADF